MESDEGPEGYPEDPPKIVALSLPTLLERTPHPQQDCPTCCSQVLSCSHRLPELLKEGSPPTRMSVPVLNIICLKEAA